MSRFAACLLGCQLLLVLVEAATAVVVHHHHHAAPPVERQVQCLGFGCEGTIGGSSGSNYQPSTDDGADDNVDNDTDNGGATTAPDDGNDYVTPYTPGTDGDPSSAGGSGTTNKVSRDFSYGYKIFVQSSAVTIEEGMSTLESEVRDKLQATIDEQGIDIDVQNLASSTQSECEPDDYTQPGFDRCANAETTVTMLIDANIDEELMTRVALAEIQTFIVEFNDSHENVKINYTYPKSVKSTVTITLWGVNGIMGEHETSIFEQTFLEGFGPRTEAHEPPYTLKTVEVAVQDSNMDRLRRFLRALQNDGGSNLPNNKLELFVRAECSEGEHCTNETFDEYLVNEVRQFSNILSVALRANGQTEELQYFEGLEDVTVDDEYSTYTPADETVHIDDNTGDVEEEGLPWYLWILVGIPVLILAIALTWVTLRMNARDEKKELAEVKQQNAEFDEEERRRSAQQSTTTTSIPVSPKPQKPKPKPNLPPPEAPRSP